jgi:hypothetical protein
MLCMAARGHGRIPTQSQNTTILPMPLHLTLLAMHRRAVELQAAIGLALFDCLLTGRTALANGLLRRPRLTERETALITTERLRAATARLELQNLLVRIARDGQVEDARRVATLVDNNNAFLRDLRQSVAALPDDQVKLATDVARRSVNMRE